MLGLAAAGAAAADARTPVCRRGIPRLPVASGPLRCWGSNADGQLANGTTRRNVVPGSVRGLREPGRVVSASYNRNCTLDSGWRLCHFSARRANGDRGAARLRERPEGWRQPKSALCLSVGVTHACVLDVSGGPVDSRSTGAVQIVTERRRRGRARSGRRAHRRASRCLDGSTVPSCRRRSSCWAQPRVCGDPLNPKASWSTQRLRGRSRARNGEDARQAATSTCALLPGGMVVLWRSEADSGRAEGLRCRGTDQRPGHTGAQDVHHHLDNAPAVARRPGDGAPARRVSVVAVRRSAR